MSALVILLNMFSNAQENKAASGFCKTVNCWSHQRGVRGKRTCVSPSCRGCHRSPKLQHRSYMPGLSAEGSFLCMICVVTMVILRGKRRTPGDPGAASTSDVLHGDTKCVHRQKVQGHPGHKKGLCDKARGEVGAGKGCTAPPALAAAPYFPPCHGMWVTTTSLGQTLAWFPSSDSHSACTNRSCPKKFIQILFAWWSSRLRLTFSAGYTFLEAFYWSLLWDEP